jgi:hypothetical protein
MIFMIGCSCEAFTSVWRGFRKHRARPDATDNPFKNAMAARSRVKKLQAGTVADKNVPAIRFAGLIRHCDEGLKDALFSAGGLCLFPKTLFSAARLLARDGNRMLKLRRI